MIKKLKELLKYRQLIQTLVSRELKARYRGSVLGFFWSLLNPLLLLIVYSVVFTVFLPQGPQRVEGISIKGINYSLFLFTGLLPWLWFSSSILESANVLFAHGNLIKKIRFPLEVLPIMTVVTNMVHFLLAIPILVISIIFVGQGSVGLTLWVLLLPIALMVQFVFVMGLGFLVSAITVHFRDLKDILANLLTIWFFATPIIYPFMTPAIQNNKWAKLFLSLNPMTHIVETYHYIFFFGRLPHWKKIPVTLAVGIVFFVVGYFIFDKLRDTFVEEV